MRSFFLALCSWSLISPTALAAGVLVLSPVELQPGLQRWIEFRTGQGWEVTTAAPLNSAEAMAGQIAAAAKQSESLACVVLIGDAAAPHTRLAAASPTAYRPSVVSGVYSGEAHIATDNPFADLDGDDAPELAIGRIPCSSPAELAGYLDRVIAFESALEPRPTNLNIVASPGRFSPLIDSMIEFTAEQALRQLTPTGSELKAIYNSPASPHFPKTPFRNALLAGLREPALAWVYLGHGSTCGLDRVEPRAHAHRILHCVDLPRTDAPTPGPVFAAMLACETGRIDAPAECLAESMLLCPRGPLAVLASSRVCMPYGNSVLGIELLNCLFEPGKSESLGECVREGKRRALRDDSKLPLRKSVRQIGLGLSPNADALDQEVVEHVQMYNLLGDPLLRVKQVAPLQTHSAD
ncbi:hypothetical protein Pla123a_24760 [Posidoniimonas polymericola]|uniref:Gingipain domain-containing protein n=1 Tax=Posidoniimonas polymericola TaxID=2528002 RepID=A0A5C5YQL8_9BACT|nr:C25 family cysteine peptidase [Posidoniimonas polymericola]TWT77047.1 hypothetical protein Pla123a_24760 [Posidoniimonas polymericola]